MCESSCHVETDAREHTVEGQRAEMTSTLPKPRTAAVVSRFALRRRWRFRAVSFAIALMTAFILAEITLRLFVPDTRSPYLYDEFTGTRLRPGHRFVYRSEGYSSSVINTRGLRDREHSLEKPAGTFRIAILGDSFAEAFQVSQEWKKVESTTQFSRLPGMLRGKSHGRSRIGCWKPSRRTPLRWARNSSL